VNVVGIVESFDDRRGDGFIASDAGEKFYFHCVSILDGTREIAVGQRVSGRRSVGHVGRDEVIDIEKKDTPRD
jgi:cold shock CspA family protein